MIDTRALRELMADPAQTREALASIEGYGDQIIPELRAILESDQSIARDVAAIGLADLGAPDADDLLLAVLRRFDYSTLPGPSYNLFGETITRIQEGLIAGRRIDVTDEMVRALDASVPNKPEWIDVRQDAIRTLGEAPGPAPERVVDILLDAVATESEGVIAPLAIDVLEEIAPDVWPRAVKVYRDRPDAQLDLIRYASPE